jgi:hypothetical protein
MYQNSQSKAQRQQSPINSSRLNVMNIPSPHDEGYKVVVQYAKAKTARSRRLFPLADVSYEPPLWRRQSARGRLPLRLQNPK